MIRERIADDVYVFTSKRYAQVTCGAILTRDGAILIDTLLYPDEARAVRDFIERRLGQPIRYVINTHYHADHTTGSYLYPHAMVVGHIKCRELLDTVGRAGLERTKAHDPEFSEVSIVLPSMVVAEGMMDISLGGKVIRLIPLPGHSPDLIGVQLVGGAILFAADALMPVPTFFDGNYNDIQESLKKIMGIDSEVVVQGHGEVVLRGEISNLVQNDLNYLERIKEEVLNVLHEGLPREMLENIGIERCGKSRIPLNGLVSDLHQANLRHLYGELSAQPLPPLPQKRA